MEVVVHLFKISKIVLSSSRVDLKTFSTMIMDGRLGGQAAGEIRTKANSAQLILAMFNIVWNTSLSNH